MKNILLFALLIVFINNVHAQDRKPGDYVKTPNNKNFEGTWKNTDENSSFTLVLKNKEKIYSKSSGLYFDKIEGDIIYIKNGVKVFDGVETVKTGFATDQYSMIASLRSKDLNKRIFISFPDKKDFNSILVKVVGYEHLGPKKTEVNPLLPSEIVLKRQ